MCVRAEMSHYTFHSKALKQSARFAEKPLKEKFEEKTAKQLVFTKEKIGKVL